MTVSPLTPDDAPYLIALAQEWDSGPVVITPGAYGVVVRDGSDVLAWGTLRETGYGMVTDELWCRKDRPGRLALGEIAKWLEATVAKIAGERGLASMPLGGMARLDNPRHCAALENRGYEHVANVYAKDIPANVPRGAVA